jgi:hypothetical protein
MRANALIIGLVILILVGYGLAFQEKEQYNKIPKKIWTYWDNPEKMPKSVKMCMAGWAKHNPQYTITLLTKKNYKGFVTIPMEIQSNPNFHDNPTRFPDLVRAWTLAEHGGIWIDASMLIKAPLDDWLFPRYAEFSGFYVDKYTKHPKYPMIENWFFACNKGSPFMKQWRDEFSRIAQYPSVEAYVTARMQMGVDIEQMKSPIYLAMNVAAQTVLQLDHYPLDSLVLRKAEDGPFRYAKDAKWDVRKGLLLACHNRTYQTPIMKLCKEERKIMEEEWDGELSDAKCGWST